MARRHDATGRLRLHSVTVALKSLHWRGAMDAHAAPAQSRSESANIVKRMNAGTARIEPRSDMLSAAHLLKCLRGIENPGGAVFGFG